MAVRVDECSLDPFSQEITEICRLRAAPVASRSARNIGICLRLGDTTGLLSLDSFSPISIENGSSRGRGHGAREYKCRKRSVGRGACGRGSGSGIPAGGGAVVDGGSMMSQGGGRSLAGVWEDEELGEGRGSFEKFPLPSPRTPILPFQTLVLGAVVFGWDVGWLAFVVRWGMGCAFVTVVWPAVGRDTTVSGATVLGVALLWGRAPA